METKNFISLTKEETLSIAGGESAAYWIGYACGEACEFVRGFVSYFC